MADLDPALQDSIDNLQTRHTALVDAVRNYTGGSIAGATNDLLAARDDVLTTVDKRETALLGLIQRDTDKPVPSLLSDFKTQTYMLGTRRLEHGVSVDDMFTVERSTSKWVFGPQGTLVEVPPDTIAYHYDPETGEALGALIEGESTNLVPNTDLTTASPSIKGDCTITTGLPDPFGGNTAVRIQGTPGNGENYCAVDFYNLGSFDGYTVASCWAKENPGNGGETRLKIRSAIGSPYFRGDWKKYSFNEDSGSGPRYFGITGGPDNDVDVTICFPQFELGTAPSSHIPTDGAPVTRGEDLVSRQGADETGGDVFTIFMEFTPNRESVAYTPWCDYVLGNFRVEINSNRVVVDLRGANEGFNSTGYELPAEGDVKLAASFGLDALVVFVNGKIAGNFSLTKPVGRYLSGHFVGSREFSGGHIKKGFHALRVIPRALSVAELETLTS